MNPASEEFEAVVARAHDLLNGHIRGSAESNERSFAEAVVAVATSCVVGAPCSRHAGMVHGHEAEELRSGIEQVLSNIADVDNGDDALHVLQGIRKSLQFLLDRIDARDSLAFRQATDLTTTQENQS